MVTDPIVMDDDKGYKTETLYHAKAHKLHIHKVAVCLWPMALSQWGITSSRIAGARLTRYGAVVADAVGLTVTVVGEAVGEVVA